MKDKTETTTDLRSEKVRYEYPDNTPVHIPGKSDRPDPLPLREDLKRYIDTRLNMQAQAAGYETEAEANDFEVDDEMTPLETVYTVREMKPHNGIPDDIEGIGDRSYSPLEDSGEAASGAAGDTQNPAPSPGTAPPT